MDILDLRNRAMRHGAPALGSWPEAERWDFINARNIFHWSQSDMAKMLGMSLRHYQRMEKGELPIPRAMAWTIHHWMKGYRRL